LNLPNSLLHLLAAAGGAGEESRGGVGSERSDKVWKRHYICPTGLEAPREEVFIGSALHPLHSCFSERRGRTIGEGDYYGTETKPKVVRKAD